MAAAGVAAPHQPAAQPTRKRMRIAMGTTEDYEETRCLGEGSFGAVVKARHRVTGENVAIKRLDAAVGGHAALLREHLFLDACAGNVAIKLSEFGLCKPLYSSTFLLESGYGMECDCLGFLCCKYLCNLVKQLMKGMARYSFSFEVD
ncbi:unnamed protein product [Urochloa humidicola]